MNLVLHNPEIPQNTGNIIRLCQNTGSDLHLIKPLGFNFQNKNLKRASMDYLDNDALIIHNSFEHFIETESPKRLFAIDTFGDQYYSDQQYYDDDYFLFGSEGSGLPKRIYEHKSITGRIKIPMVKESRSLNLSNAAAVILYEGLRQTGFQNLK